MQLCYDPLSRKCKSEIGAIKRGSEVLFQTYYCPGGEENFSAESCTLEFYKDDGTRFSFPMHRCGDRFQVRLRFSQVGLYFYYFSLGENRFLGRGPLRRAIQTEHPESWQITVCDEEYETPQWFKGGVMYQIFPDRFFRAGSREAKPYQILRDDWGGQPNFRRNSFGKVLNNDFFGGDLEGIRQKLDYLAALHVKTIYLNPIFEAYSNHRYDTGDYLKIDGLLGTEADFEALTRDAQARGIRILLDGVFNHTGDDSRYFNKYGRYDSLGAYQSPDSPYADWYHFQRFPDSYDSWWGIETLPAVNEQSASYREFMFGDEGVLKTWLRRGASGYRIDVADELPDFFLKRLRETVKSEDPQALILGEVWEDASNKISYDVRRQYLQGYELDSVMNYPLKNAIIHFARTGRTDELRETIAMLRDNYPKQTLDCLMNILGTHDTPRILTVMGGKQCADKEEMARTALSEDERNRAERLVRLAAVLQYTLPGVPCIYYGDEVGMEGYMDPFCRGCFPWDKQEGSLSAFYRRLGEIRTELAPRPFIDGEYEELFADAGCLVFARSTKEQSVYVYCNPSTNRYTLHLPDGEYRELLQDRTVASVSEIGADCYGILLKVK